MSDKLNVRAVPNRKAKPGPNYVFSGATAQFNFADELRRKIITSDTIAPDTFEMRTYGVPATVFTGSFTVPIIEDA